MDSVNLETLVVEQVVLVVEQAVNNFELIVTFVVVYFAQAAVAVEPVVVQVVDNLVVTYFLVDNIAAEVEQVVQAAEYKQLFALAF